MREAINRAWRIVATGFCFSVFGLGGIVLGIVVCPVAMLFVRGAARQKQLCQTIIHHSFRCFVGLMNFVGVISYEVHGRERLQRRGLLILANHPSLIDVVFLILRRRDILGAVQKADAGDGVVLLTDMFGGTPSNLSISIMDEARVEVIAGVNLPMLIKLATVRSEAELAKAVDLAKEAGRKYISVASQVLAGES